MARSLHAVPGSPRRRQQRLPKSRASATRAPWLRRGGRGRNWHHRHRTRAGAPSRSGARRCSAARHRRIRGRGASLTARGARRRDPYLEPRRHRFREPRCGQLGARLRSKGRAVRVCDRGATGAGSLIGRVLFVPVAVLGDTGGVDVGSPDLKEREAARISVVLADDAVLLREGIASLLERAGFEVVGQSGTAEDLLLKVRSYKPDIAIVDIKMPPTHTDEGLRAAKGIRERYPDT